MPLPSFYPYLLHETLMQLVRQKSAALGLRFSERKCFARFVRSKPFLGEEHEVLWHSEVLLQNWLWEGE